MTNAKPTKASLNEINSIVPVHVKNLLMAYKEECRRYPNYGGYSGLKQYYDGQYCAYRTVQLMLEGVQFLEATKIAQGEINQAKAEIESAIAKAEGRAE
jgi:hypothetical protein